MAKTLSSDPYKPGLLKTRQSVDYEISLMVKLYIFQGYYGARAAAFPRAWRQGSSRGRCRQEDRQEDVLPGLWILPLDHS